MAFLPTGGSFLADIAMPLSLRPSGKAVQYGNNVSHANNKTRRRFMSNLQVASVSRTRWATPCGCVHAARHQDHRAQRRHHSYLLGTNDSKLSPEMKVLKRRVVRPSQEGSQGGGVSADPWRRQLEQSGCYAEAD